MAEGVAAHESNIEVEPCGKEVAAWTKKRLDGKTVYLELDVGDRNKYGPLLGCFWSQREGRRPFS